MTKESLSAITDVLFERLCEAMESGANDDVKAVLKTMSAFHDYSFANVCLILSQFPNATKVAGFRTWEKFDRHVMKGQHGIGISRAIVGASCHAGRRDQAGYVDA